jgi:hypothetical protein
MPKADATLLAIERRIYLIRGQKVMLDRDLAELYEVRAIALRQQVKRNRERFPPDFVFRLSEFEAKALVSQNVIPSRRSLGGFLPYAFTEQGVAMLSSVLRSARASHVNVAIMRAFVRMRELVATHKDLARKLAQLELKYQRHGAQIERHDLEIQKIFEAMRRLIEQPTRPRRQIGFRASDAKLAR